MKSDIYENKMFIIKNENLRKCFLTTENYAIEKIKLIGQQIIKIHYVWAAKSFSIRSNNQEFI